MRIKYAADIIKEIRERRSIEIPEEGVAGEEFEQWLRSHRNGGNNETVSRNNSKESKTI